MSIFEKENVSKGYQVGPAGSASSISTEDDAAKLDMTLRDYFASQALQGILVNHILKLDAHAINNFAKTSYDYADAMLRARGQVNTTGA